MPTKPLIYDLSFQEFHKLFQFWGEPKYRANQIWQGLYQQYWSTADKFTNLPHTLRERIKENFSFTQLTPIQEVSSQDNHTVKTLFKLDNDAGVEAVLMHYPPSKENKNGRQTLCISTQVGCAMGCVFCATGQMGFNQNLSSGEIIEQVIFYARQLDTRNKRVSNIVIMVAEISR